MAKKKTSSKLKSHKAAAAWRMIRDGASYADIAEAVGHTVTAVKLYARRKYKDESEKLWAAEIKAVGVCEICGSTEQLQSHHLLEKSIWTSLARDLSNGICLCEDHHLFNPQISPHGCMVSGEEFIAWLKEWRNGQWLWFEEHKHDRKYIECDWQQAYNELK